MTNIRFHMFILAACAYLNLSIGGTWLCWGIGMLCAAMFFFLIFLFWKYEYGSYKFCHYIMHGRKISFFRFLFFPPREKGQTVGKFVDVETGEVEE